MARVNVFVSSTCYDLAQIRTDIKQCIIDMGHNPILSENKDFPVDTNLSSVENCINAVKREADIFILIIGNKYGSVMEEGKSITNTEFLTAVQKGIPIYTFTLKQMINILPIWEKNPSMDFSTTVDNPKIFEFISDIRKERGLWNFEFERAQDIVETLKAQFSILLKESLSIRNKMEQMNRNEDIFLYSKVSSRALNLMMRKEEYFEIKFYMQVMCDKVLEYRFLKNDYKYSVVIKSPYQIMNHKQFFDWTNLKFSQLTNLINSANKLTSPFSMFYGEPGVASNLEGLYYIAETYSRIYASILEWGIEVQSINAPDEYQNALTAMSKLPSSIIQQFENYPSDSLKEINETIRKSKEGILPENYCLTLNMNFTIDKDVVEKYNEELHRVGNIMLNREVE